MDRLDVVPHGDSVAVVFPSGVLESIGVQVGETVEAAVRDGALILRAAAPPSASDSIDTVTDEVFERHADAYRRLA